MVWLWWPDAIPGHHSTLNVSQIMQLGAGLIGKTALCTCNASTEILYLKDLRPKLSFCYICVYYCASLFRKDLARKFKISFHSGTVPGNNIQLVTLDMICWMPGKIQRVMLFSNYCTGNVTIPRAKENHKPNWSHFDWHPGIAILVQGTMPLIIMPILEWQPSSSTNWTSDTYKPQNY